MSSAYTSALLALWVHHFPTHQGNRKGGCSRGNRSTISSNENKFNTSLQIPTSSGVTSFEPSHHLPRNRYRFSCRYKTPIPGLSLFNLKVIATFKTFTSHIRKELAEDEKYLYEVELDKNGMPIPDALMGWKLTERALKVREGVR